MGKDARQLTDAEKEMGPGLTIYFRQMKLMTTMFILFSILVIPQFILITRSSNEEELHHAFHEHR